MCGSDWRAAEWAGTLTPRQLSRGGDRGHLATWAAPLSGICQGLWWEPAVWTAGRQLCPLQVSPHPWALPLAGPHLPWPLGLAVSLQDPGCLQEKGRQRPALVLLWPLPLVSLLSWTELGTARMSAQTHLHVWALSVNTDLRSHRCGQLQPSAVGLVFLFLY